jgi:hypothetical protein
LMSCAAFAPPRSKRCTSTATPSPNTPSTRSRYAHARTRGTT